MKIAVQAGLPAKRDMNINACHYVFDFRLMPLDLL